MRQPVKKYKIILRIYAKFSTKNGGKPYRFCRFTVWFLSVRLSISAACRVIPFLNIKKGQLGYPCPPPFWRFAHPQGKGAKKGGGRVWVTPSALRPQNRNFEVLLWTKTQQKRKGGLGDIESHKHFKRSSIAITAVAAVTIRKTFPCFPPIAKIILSKIEPMTPKSLFPIPKMPLPFHSSIPKHIAIILVYAWWVEDLKPSGLCHIEAFNSSLTYPPFSLVHFAPLFVVV